MKKTDKKAVKKALSKTVKKEVKKASTRKPVAKKPASKMGLKGEEKPTGKGKSAKTHALHDLVMKALDKEKGENVLSIDLAGKSAIADYMIVVSGSSSRQIVSMAKKVRDKVVEAGYRAKVEGADSGDWVILDAGDVIVHFFRPEVREFYNLEKLWSTDFSTIDYTLYKSV